MKEWICKHHFVKQIFALVLAALLVVQSSGMTVLADDVQNDAESIQEEIRLPQNVSSIRMEKKYAEMHFRKVIIIRRI